MSGTSASITIVPGKDAPRYDEGEAVQLQEVVITEQGTVAGLPIVDFVCRDQHGHQFVLSLTGRVVLTIANTLRGVNQRNHGTPEP